MRGFMVALAPALLMASCAATSTGPVAGIDGSWTISKRGVVATQPEALTRAATQEATAHCAVQGKRIGTMAMEICPSGLLAARAETSFTFVCE